MHTLLKIAHSNPSLIPDLRSLIAAKAMVPSGENVALFTLDEYIKILNPEGKMHPIESYETDLKNLNLKWSHREIGEVVTFRSNEEMYLYQNDKGYLIKQEGNIIATIKDGTLYTTKHKAWVFQGRSKVTYRSERSRGEYSELPYERVKIIKYPYEGMSEVETAVRTNLASFPHIVQRYKIKDETFELRIGEKPYKLNSGDTIAILNSQGLVVGAAVDEWGATLVQVAREYWRFGLGKILAKAWSAQNPKYDSGGFTGHGLAMRERIWEEEVRNFLAKGGYTAMINKGLISKQRVKEILSDLSAKRPTTHSPLPKAPDQPKQKEELLVYADGTTFVLYDRRFYDENDDAYIYGYGFLRDDSSVGTFYYTLDYIRKYDKLTTAIALQMAKDEGSDLYVGQGYSDYIEADLVPAAVQEGDYLTLTRDLLNLKQLSRQEARIRKSLDAYGEQYALLLEAAESKDW